LFAGAVATIQLRCYAQFRFLLHGIKKCDYFLRDELRKQVFITP